MRQLARTDAKDAPDEGKIAAPTLGTGRVLDDLKKYNAAIYDYRRGEYYDG